MRPKPVDQVGVPAECLLKPHPVALAAQLALLPARLLAVEALLEPPALVVGVGQQRVRLGAELGPERGVVGGGLAEGFDGVGGLRRHMACPTSLPRAWRWPAV